MRDKFVQRMYKQLLIAKSINRFIIARKFFKDIQGICQAGKRSQFILWILVKVIVLIHWSMVNTCQHRTARENNCNHKCIALIIFA